MDNDSAEVKSSGRSFHVRGPTTGKARLVGDGCQLNRRHWQTVGASRTERSAARQVGDIVEWTKVRVRARFYRPERQSCTELAPARATSIKADKGVGDVVGSTEMVCQSRSRVQH